MKPHYIRILKHNDGRIAINEFLFHHVLLLLFWLINNVRMIKSSKIVTTIGSQWDFNMGLEFFFQEKHQHLKKTTTKKNI